MASIALYLIHWAISVAATAHPSHQPWLAPPSSKSPVEYDYFHSAPVVDVRETQLLRVHDVDYLNSHWVAHWITTKSNLDLVLVSFVSLRAKEDDPEGSNHYGGSIYEFESGFFSKYVALGETASFDPNVLNIQFKDQYQWFSNSPDSFSSITTIGNWDNHGWNITFEPRGPNLYDGGSAAFFWGSDYNREWAAPNAFTTGTVTINGSRHEIDPTRSTAWYDRQWGVGLAINGWYWFPLQLVDGTRICVWALNPVGNYHKSFGTVLKPDGSHEVVTMLPDIHPENSWVSKETNITYYASFTLSFPEKGTLRIVIPQGKERQYGEFGAQDKSATVYEAYAEVNGVWEGKSVRGWGLSEQKPFYA
ncbi:uncharacterized protein FOBCDRAFT_262651 [Fusarium oxysporum Fo47]|uniref:Uncharacterized protein n=1 Tax=Fusarium oxysporum Fo47 TaxID=660027 RepID=W9JDU0_FUSOX|nr:uncharacterized protein FOBCDRAFT_262651 [Fusarium oxysporum Fo47]EWZ28639.1 hypothetical protein FOZG_17644 [Fusarium oxysporum Fo47]QKD57155.1 hypothetical protein FOBCDRAFT_262651 [Fusarium oxysporum Fo47]